MVGLKKFNCSNLKDKDIFVKYYENLGYNVEKNLLKKVKVIRKFDGFTKTFTFVIDDEALVLDFDNNNNLTKTSISVTYKDNIKLF
tara:strand:- start:117 stop:374 length:258 start_codon:yes stop_codon:yes gene_type:complete